MIAVGTALCLWLERIGVRIIRILVLTFTSQLIPFFSLLFTTALVLPL